jgi:hypothetical protein
MIQVIRAKERIVYLELIRRIETPMPSYDRLIGTTFEDLVARWEESARSQSILTRNVEMLQRTNRSSAVGVAPTSSPSSTELDVVSGSVEEASTLASSVDEVDVDIHEETAIVDMKTGAIESRYFVRKINSTTTDTSEKATFIDLDTDEQISPLFSDLHKFKRDLAIVGDTMVYRLLKIGKDQDRIAYTATGVRLSPSFFVADKHFANNGTSFYIGGNKLYNPVSFNDLADYVTTDLVDAKVRGLAGKLLSIDEFKSKKDINPNNAQFIKTNNDVALFKYETGRLPI